MNEREVTLAREEIIMKCWCGNEVQGHLEYAFSTLIVGWCSNCGSRYDGFYSHKQDKVKDIEWEIPKLMQKKKEGSDEKI